MQINFFRLKTKLVILLVILCLFVLGGVRRALAYTSNPNGYAFCTIGPLDVQGVSAWMWRCYTNDELYNVTSQMYTQLKVGGYIADNGGLWYADLFSPVNAYAAILPTIDVRSNQTKMDYCADPSNAALCSQTGNLPSGAVFVSNTDNYSQEIKNTHDYMNNNGQMPPPVDCTKYCIGSDGPHIWDASYQNMTVTCLGSCDHPICKHCTPPVTFTGTITMNQPWNGGCSGFAYVYQSDVDAACAGAAAVVESQAVANKVVDDATSKSNVGNAMARDAAKGATTSTSPPSGAIDSTGAAGNQGLSSTPSGAGANAGAQTGNGTTPGGNSNGQGTDVSALDKEATQQAMLAKLNSIDSKTGSSNGGIDSSSYTGGDGSGHAPYRGVASADTKTALTTGLSDQFTSFKNSMMATSFFSTTQAFFNVVPAGSLGSIAINGGRSFGTTQFDFSKYSQALNILKGVVLVICTFIGIRIVTKGSG